jgi:UDP-galactopyranose mutase
MVPFIYRSKVNYENKIYSFPINLHTINQVYDASFSPIEAKKFIKSESLDIQDCKNFEDMALNMVGEKLYSIFLKEYTQKQWGISPKRIPSDVLKRLPIRFDYNDNYFFHKYQAIPKNGYTDIIQNILNHPNISVKLNVSYSREMESIYEKIYYSGKIDEYFDYCLGELPYRTLKFDTTKYNLPDFQGNCIINYTSSNIPYTRITEHKHFQPWENSTDYTIVTKEYSQLATRDSIPYYPLRMSDDKELLTEYENLKTTVPNVEFVGRLGTYRYLDMDVTIAEALKIANIEINKKIHEKRNCNS